ncbi:uracil DNA glycosylase [Podila humilis]|nr:uracil DNA glycosylase [Podila humilis]
MSKINKRAAESHLVKDEQAKRTSSVATPAVKQQSLLSWAKAVPGSTKVHEVRKDGDDKNDGPAVVTAVTTVVSKARPDILKNVKEDQRDLLFLEQDSMEGSWLRALQAEFSKPYFLELKKFLKLEEANKQQVFPPKSDIYSWSRYTPLPTVRVVILGQDPYHDDNQAHGLCFSVKKPVRPPPSLKNIFKLLETDIPGFKIPDHGYLESWARQGVLMVNAAMSVRAHQANSHKGKGWEKLLDAVVKTVNDQRMNVVFLLWGKDAQNRGALINKNKHLVLNSVHPSPLSAHRGFFESACFSKANKYLIDNGQAPINWNSLCGEK